MTSPSRTLINVGLATTAKLCGALITVKILSTYLGPAGLGAMGNYMTAVTLVGVLASAGTSAAITRSVARSGEAKFGTSLELRTVMFVILATTALLAVTVGLMKDFFSAFLFGDEKYADLLVVAITLTPLLGMSVVSIAILNGLSATLELALVQVVVASVGVTTLFALTVTFGMPGAAAGIVLIASLPSIISLPFLLRKAKNRSFLLPRFEYGAAKALFPYAVASTVAIVSQSICQFAVRALIENSHGLVQVGYWQAMSRTSDAYLQVFGAFLVAYLLPRLAVLSEISAERSEIRRVFVFIAPILTGAFFILYIFRDLFILVAFSADFAPVSDLFLPQMVADFARICSFIPGYLAIARGRTMLMVLADPVQVLLVLALSPVFISSYGAWGACFAAASAYLAYAGLTVGIMAWYFRRNSRVKQ